VLAHAGGSIARAFGVAVNAAVASGSVRPVRADRSRGSSSISDDRLWLYEEADTVPVEPSSSARRVVAVLTHLASSEHESTLSEIARASAMNKTTCQSILLALADSGYVSRHDDRKTYRLGPAVLALSASVGPHQEALARARVAMEAISADLDVETTATVATDRAILKVAQVPRPRLRGLSLRPGQTVPLAFPLGAAHVAWSDADVVSQWLERGGANARAADRTRALADLAVVRERGFSATARGTRRPGSKLHVPLPDGQVHDVRRSARLVHQVAAPVFGPDGHVILTIGVLEHAEADAGAVGRHVDRLLDAAHATTAAVGGATPAAERGRRSGAR
jgi:DNA-binding IclR family transcriptional regulator